MDVVVAYDRRVLEAAASHGLTTASPGTEHRGPRVGVARFTDGGRASDVAGEPVAEPPR